MWVTNKYKLFFIQLQQTKSMRLTIWSRAQSITQPPLWYNTSHECPSVEIGSLSEMQYIQQILKWTLILSPAVSHLETCFNPSQRPPPPHFFLRYVYNLSHNFCRTTALFSLLHPFYVFTMFRYARYWYCMHSSEICSFRNSHSWYIWQMS